MIDFASLLSLLNPAQYGISLLDIIIIFVVIFYAYEGYSVGLILATLDLASFVVSFILALKFYPYIANVLMVLFGFPIGFANAIAFFFIAIVSELVLGLLVRKVLHKFPTLPETHVAQKFLKSVDHWLGFLPGMLSAFIVLSFLLSVIVSLPSSPLVKQLVTNSTLGTQLIANTSFFEAKLNDIFGGALNETLNFLTVKPASHESVELHFTLANGNVDEIAEQEMLVLVNGEREKAGLPPVVEDAALREVARSHSRDMFLQGYFSHYSPDGQSPFDRMDKAGIGYSVAGENLALAPSTQLAMQGLMNSPGHRANILNPDFKKLGVGVIDGGVYGKMYSQEFTD